MGFPRGDGGGSGGKEEVAPGGKKWFSRWFAVVRIPKAHVNHHSDAGSGCSVVPSHVNWYSRWFSVAWRPKPHVNHHSDAGSGCLVVPSRVKWYSRWFVVICRPKAHVNHASNLISSCKAPLRCWFCVFRSSKSRKMVFQLICSRLEAQTACKSSLQSD